MDRLRTPVSSAEHSAGLVPATREALLGVWQLADATLRQQHTGLLADLAWATMLATAWSSGVGRESPVSQRRIQGPTAREIREELDLCGEQFRQAVSNRDRARWDGTTQGLSFALGAKGPFWWHSEPAVTSIGPE
jgi:hypothetical protein